MQEEQRLAEFVNSCFSGTRMYIDISDMQYSDVLLIAQRSLRVVSICRIGDRMITKEQIEKICIDYHRENNKNNTMSNTCLDCIDRVYDVIRIDTAKQIFKQIESQDLLSLRKVNGVGYIIYQYVALKKEFGLD